MVPESSCPLPLGFAQTWIATELARSIALNANKTAKRIFQSAENFLAARDALHAENLSGPYVVLAAFTVELYLKTLSEIRIGTCMATHDLWELFDALDRQTKDQLRKRHARLLSEDDSFDTFRNVGLRTDLDFFLELNKHAFEHYRYPHEGKARSIFFLSIFTQCLRERIIQLYPEWKTV